MWQPAPRWPWIAFALITLAAMVFGLADISWAGWRPATCMPDDCFCEAVRPGAIAQPVNAYSNLAFVLVGLLILGGRRSPGTNQGTNSMLSRPVYSRVFGAATVLIGLGSLFYHASLSFAGQWFDVMGMYLLATFMVLYNLTRFKPLSGLVFAGAYAGINILLGILLIVAPEVRRPVFAGSILVIIALETWIIARRRPQMRYSYFGAALLSFAVAYGIWLLDNTGLVCTPESVWQGHALWHILGAMAAGLIYAYYCSEQPAARTDL